MDPELYTVEPYVTPGNVNGPESTWFGQGGWTWYTGSAAWLRRICLEWIIGVRPELDGLIISPCLPPEWDEIKITRPFRGDTLEITLRNPNHLQPGEIQLEVDGSPHPQGVPVKASGKKQNRKIVATVIKKSEIELEV
jgi:cellobiose phosphorylase